MDRKKLGLILGGVAVFGLGILLVISLVVKPFNDTRDLTPGEAEAMKIGGEETDKEATEQLKEYPILKWIPYVVDEYSDDMMVYTNYEIWPEYLEGEFAVVIRDYTGGNEQVAKSRIESFGIKLSDYKIRYEDLSMEYGSVRVPDD